MDIDINTDVDTDVASNIRSCILVPRPKERVMPKTMVCRIRMFMWSFAAWETATP